MMFILLLIIFVLICLGTNSPLSEDDYESSNDYMQEIFLDRKFSDDTSKELKKGKLGEMVKKVVVEKKLKQKCLER